MIVKHSNPCGVGTGVDPTEAFTRAWEGDPLSAYGGVVAFNCPLDSSAAEALTEVFVEVVAAPRVTPEAAEVLSAKPNLPESGRPRSREVSSGRYARSGPDFLVQTPDQPTAVPEEWRVVSRVSPDAGRLSDLGLAWVVAAHAKSNAVVICRDGRSVGVGAGDQSRVGAARRAIATAGDRAEGAVAASDGFFPFRDGVDTLASVGRGSCCFPRRVGARRGSDRGRRPTWDGAALHRPPAFPTLMAAMLLKGRVVAASVMERGGCRSGCPGQVRLRSRPGHGAGG